MPDYTSAHDGADIDAAVTDIEDLQSTGLSGVNIDGGTIDGTTIGGNSAAAVSSSSGALNGTLGATTPAAANVTTLEASGDLTVSGTAAQFGPTATGFSALITGETTLGSYVFESRRTGTGTEGHTVFVNGNGAVGSIQTNASATSYNTSSDPRLKSDFTPFDASEAWCEFDKILASSGTFHFLADPGKVVWGMDAHKIVDDGFDIGSEGEGPRELNLGDVYKDAVLDEHGDEIEPALVVTPAGVDQSKVVPYLIAVIADLRDRLDALES